MAGRTYRFFEGETLFPFGHGLSYSQFEYKGANMLYNPRGELSFISIRVKIENTGPVDGDEIIQVYIRHPESDTRKPSKTLVGFLRVHVPSGETVFENIPLDIDFMKRWDPEKQAYILLPGKYAFLIGASSEDIRLELSKDFE